MGCGRECGYGFGFAGMGSFPYLTFFPTFPPSVHSLLSRSYPQLTAGAQSRYFGGQFHS